jgi:hypothetical protein
LERNNSKHEARASTHGEGKPRCVSPDFSKPRSVTCFRDIAYCAGDGCEDFDFCNRALTQQIRDEAERTGLPIAQFTDPKKMHCYRKKIEYSEAIGMLLADGFEEALIGTARRSNGMAVAVYDTNKCLEILSRDMSPEDAEEYFSFNVEGAWMGERTPIFLDTNDYD